MADGPKQKIRIRLEGLRLHEILDQSTEKIVQTVLRPRPRCSARSRCRPTSTATSVIRSPHKYKDSREHSSRCGSTSAWSTSSSTSKTAYLLQRLDLPAGVDIEIKIQTA